MTQKTLLQQELEAQEWVDNLYGWGRLIGSLIWRVAILWALFSIASSLKDLAS